MTGDELDALECLEKAATPGPWRIVNDGFSAGVSSRPEDPDKRSVWPDICGGDSHEGYRDGPDMEFIAAVRNALPVLLIELRASRKLFNAIEDLVRGDHFVVGSIASLYEAYCKVLGKDA